MKLTYLGRCRFGALLLGAASLLPGGPARAQAPRAGCAPPPPATLDLDAGLACARAHQAQAQRQTATTAAATAATTASAAGISVSHRQQMDRYDVLFYRLDLNLENNSRDVSGTTLLRVKVLDSPSAVPLDSIAFELYQAPAGAAAGAPTLIIDGVTVERVGGGPVVASPGVLRRGQQVTAALPRPAAPGTVLNVRVSYRGTAPNGNSAAIGNALNTASSFRRGGVTYPYNVTWSLSEPFSAHEWFACKQVLTDKADSCAVVVTTTLPNKVGSNGLLRRTTLLPGNRVRYEWRESHPIAYYLISVAVAPYVEYQSTANPVGGPAIPVLNYVYDAASLAYWQTEFDRLPGFIENFSSLVGTYYFADEKYGLALAPIGGGMEHQTLTTQDGITFTLSAHELFHQWFGDNVTCASWEDIWLNEGFASYGEYLALQAFGDPGQPRAWMDDAQARARVGNGAGGGTVRLPDTTSVGRIFNFNLSYKKGASLVHLLRYVCHDDARFFRVLRTYQRQFSGRTARTRDLQQLFEAELGQPLTYFFDQWYRGEGVPTFNVRWNQVGSTLGLRVSEVVSRPASTAFFQTEVDYQLTLQDGSTRVVRFSQTQPEQTFTVPLGAGSSPVVAVAVDPAGWLPDLPGSVVQDNSLVLAARSGLSSAPLQVFPNPCREQLTLANLAAAPARAEVLDATGRLVFRQPLSVSASLNTSGLASGLYQVRLFGAGGELLGQARFVRE